jgi:hypothetical protein
MKQLTTQTRTYILSGAVSAGTDGSFVTSLAEIDTQGFNSVRFIVMVGTVTPTGVINLRLKNSDTTAAYGSGTIDNMLSAAGTVSDRLVLMEVFKPLRRFLRLDYQRITANVVITGIIVELFNANEEAVSQLSTHVSATAIANQPTPSVS